MKNILRQFLFNDSASRKNLDDNLSRMVESLGTRIEFIRTEIIYEMRYGLKESNPTQDSKKIDSKILHVDKLKRQTEVGTVKINLGCGHKPKEDYINVDMRDIPGVDIVAAVDCLPFEENSVSEIYTSHLIEHFPEEKLVRHILPYWLSVLKPGGTIRIVAPDAESMCKAFSNGEMSFRDFKEVTFGAQDYDGDFHYTMFTPDSIVEILTTVGFTKPRLLDYGRINGLCRELEVLATKKHQQ